MRSCSPSGAPASSSTTSAARWKASAPTPNRRRSVAAEIVAAGGAAVADTSDVASEAGAQTLVDTAVERFGRLDILVNNAGIMRWAGFPKADADNLERHLAVHRRRIVQHHPRRVAAHGRTGLRPHRHDDVSGMFGLPEEPLVRHRQGAASSGSRAASRPPAPRTASRSTSSHPRRSRAWPARRPTTRPKRRQMAPELVAPMVAFLAHEDCPVSGEIYAAGAGRFARIFIASTRATSTRRPRRRSRTSPSTGRDQRRDRLLRPGRPHGLVGRLHGAPGLTRRAPVPRARASAPCPTGSAAARR